MLELIPGVLQGITGVYGGAEQQQQAMQDPFLWQRQQAQIRPWPPEAYQNAASNLSFGYVQAMESPDPRPTLRQRFKAFCLAIWNAHEDS